MAFMYDSKGTWNDEENWEYPEVMWKKALNIARAYHQRARNNYVTWHWGKRTVREDEAGNKVSYLEFIQNVMKILVDEAKVQDDKVLTAAALYNITELTDYSRPVIEKEFSSDIAEMVQFLRRTQEEPLEAYITRCMEQKDAETLILVLLAVKLQEQRWERCPFDSWEEDIPYYREMTEQLKPFVEGVFRERNMGRAVLLGEKLLKEIERNMDVSWNMNKTPEELYAGWDD